jgi:hypothetical protein
MLFKSVTGYVVAFFVGLAVYVVTVRTVEKRFINTSGAPPQPYWIVLQWGSTAFLWTQWLIQDLANIFVFLPRQLDWTWFLAALGVMVALHAIVFYTAGGAIQKIVTSKTNTTDIRSATIVDFIYGFILLVFKEWSNMPMSTTWVFLGLLAGRELAISIVMMRPPFKHVARIAGIDLSKAGAGLAASVILALTLPKVFPGDTGGPRVAVVEKPKTEQQVAAPANRQGR